MAKKILIIVAVCVIAVVGFLVVRTKYSETKRSEKATNIIEAAIKKLDADPLKAKEEIELLAQNIALRNVLYDALKESGKLQHFPNRYLNQESLAESDLAFWLSHPNELGKAPDDIELKAKISKKMSNDKTGEFYLFRFRVKEPHWAAKNGWMAGMTGPYIKGGGLETSAEGTFSELDAFDSKSADEHVTYLLSNLGSLLTTKTSK